MDNDLSDRRLFSSGTLLQIPIQPGTGFSIASWFFESEKAAK